MYEPMVDICRNFFQLANIWKVKIRRALNGSESRGKGNQTYIKTV